MKQTSFANIQNGAVQTVCGIFRVSLPVGVSPATVYRRVIFLQFPATAEVEGIRIDKDATDMQIGFGSLDLDANGDFESDLVAILDCIDSETVSVRLDIIRRIRKVQLSAYKVSGAGHKIEFYSLVDGEISAAPQVTASLNNGEAELSHDFSSDYFVLRIKGPGHSKLPLAPDDVMKLVGEHPKVASVMVMDGNTKKIILDRPRRIREIHFSASSSLAADTHLEFFRMDGDTVTEKPSISTAISNRIATLSDEFMDGGFSVRVKKLDGTYLSQGSWDVQNIILSSDPTGPRLGIATPTDLISESLVTKATPSFFWQQPEEIQEATGFQVPAEIRKVFADNLQRHLDSYFDYRKRGDLSGNAEVSASKTVSAALVFESDLPCQINVNAFQVGYHLRLKNPFASGEAKKVLRFTEANSINRIEICLPAKSKVSSAQLRTIESFKPHRPQSGEQTESFEQEIAEDTGAHLGIDRWTAQRINLSQALVVSGIRLGILSLTNNTELLVQVCEDWQGLPLGNLLFEGFHEPRPLGQRRWSCLELPRSIELFAQTYWLLVKTARGQAVWLAKASENTIHVMTHPGRKLVALLGGLLAFHEWVIPRVTYENDEEDNITSLRIHEQKVLPDTPAGDSKFYNITGPLNAALQTADPTSSPLTVPLMFTAALPGITTVYPPDIEFDLDG